jgi:hypothetical protein
LNMSFTGVVSRDGDNALFKARRGLPGASVKSGITGLISTYQWMQAAGKRLDAEAARRGQSVPIVRKIK